MTTTQNLNRGLARRIRVLAPLAVLICASCWATATQTAAAASGRTVTNSAIETQSLRHATENSTNWAGYAVTPLEATTSTPPATPPTQTTFTSVSGNWVQPKVSCTKLTLQLRNLTRKTNITKTLFMAEPDLSSAEWIAEAPTGCNSSRCVQLPLAKFSMLTFTKASATTSDGHTGTINDVSWSPTVIDLADIASGPPATETSGALPSTLLTNGASFAIVWQQAISTAAASR